MKKQVLTKQDIQKELLAKLNKLKPISILLTVLVISAMILYPKHLIEHLDGNTRGILWPTLVTFFMPLLIIFFTVFVFRFYYLDLYKIKKGKFEILKDTLCQKDEEWRYYYRNAQKENSLYFRYGRVAVEDNVYSYSNTGDKFYIVILKSKSKSKAQLVYHTKYYEIRND